MIVCGWCAVPTDPARCVNCGRDPALPWLQRAQEPPPYDTRVEKRRRLAQMERDHPEKTDEQIAELLGIDPRSVRRWRRLSA